jgi:murein L,D-transpeptidase YafK
MITIKVFRGKASPRIAHVKDKRDLISWVNLLHSEFDEIVLTFHKPDILKMGGSKKISFKSKRSFDDWAKN